MRIANWFQQVLSHSGFPVPYGTPLINLENTRFIATNDGNPGDNDGWYGRCSVVVREDNVVVLTYREGARHDSEAYGIIHIRFSSDYGETWSQEDKYLDGSSIVGFPLRPTGAGNPSGNNRGPSHGLLILCPNGDLLCQMWNSDYGADNLGAHQSRSTDGGRSWSASQQVIFGNYGGNQNRFFFGEGHTIVNGVIYSGARNYHLSSPQTEANYVVKSEDNGLTWNVVGQITTTSSPAPRGTQEVSLEYLGNGRFIALLREAANQDGHFAYSTDYCQTWSAPVDITSALGIGPTSWLGRTQVKTRAHLKRQNSWWLDRVLIVCGFTGGTDNESTGSRRNAVWVGIIPKDYNLANISWNGPFYVDVAGYDGGYGDMFYNPELDQFVFCSYRAPTSLFDASAKQYNFSLTFG
jgi:hypothetical protein